MRDGRDDASVNSEDLEKGVSRSVMKVLEKQLAKAESDLTKVGVRTGLRRDGYSIDSDSNPRNPGYSGMAQLKAGETV